MPLLGVRHKVRELRVTNPHWSLGDIALEVGVSRQRVHELLRAEGLPTRKATPRRIFDAVLAQMPEPEHTASTREATLSPEEATNAG